MASFVFLLLKSCPQKVSMVGAATLRRPFCQFGWQFQSPYFAPTGLLFVSCRFPWRCPGLSYFALSGLNNNRPANHKLHIRWHPQAKLHRSEAWGCSFKNIDFHPPMGCPSDGDFSQRLIVLSHFILPESGSIPAKTPYAGDSQAAILLAGMAGVNRQGDET
ncbi:MAG: hypothetical protein HZA50_17260 [Planctomycetes bacterium]|nr:hypothetical protein [Planctomycetota bacterium]